MRELSLTGSAALQSIVLFAGCISSSTVRMSPSWVWMHKKPWSQSLTWHWRPPSSKNSLAATSLLSSPKNKGHRFLTAGCMRVQPTICVTLFCVFQSGESWHAEDASLGGVSIAIIQFLQQTHGCEPSEQVNEPEGMRHAANTTIHFAKFPWRY